VGNNSFATFFLSWQHEIFKNNVYASKELELIIPEPGREEVVLGH
jgi:hypothetical protein